jgi:hypothetical protein
LTISTQDIERSRWAVLRLAQSSEEKILLSLSDFHKSEGWGVPANEFMIRLSHLEVNRYLNFFIDLKGLEPWVGPISTINGFRLRSGLKISHFCVCDEMPAWLETAVEVRTTDAPLVAIERPSSDAGVEQEHVVEGTFSNFQRSLVNKNDIQVFVRSPDRFWYLQGPLAIENGRWRVKAFFGNSQQGAGSEFVIAALTTTGEPPRKQSEQPPPALGRSFVRVTRKQ